MVLAIQMNAGRIARGTVVALLIFAVLNWVYPTQWQYFRMGATQLRTHRITGRTQSLTYYGWEDTHDHDQSSAATEADAAFSSEDLAKLEGKLEITDYDSIRAEIYNGTAKELREITVEVKIMNAEKEAVLTRQYRLTTPGYCEPLEVDTFSARSGIQLEAGQTFEWRIVSAVPYSF